MSNIFIAKTEDPNTFKLLAVTSGEGDELNITTRSSYICSKDKYTAFCREYGITLVPKLTANKHSVDLYLDTNALDVLSQAKVVAIDFTPWSQQINQVLVNGLDKTAYLTLPVDTNNPEATKFYQKIIDSLYEDFKYYLPTTEHYRIELPVSSYIANKETKQGIDIINSLAIAAPTEDSNGEAFQAKPSDPLCLSLPTVNEVINNLDFSSFTRLSNIFRPYNNPIYRTTLWFPRNDAPMTLDRIRKTLVKFDIFTKEEEEEIANFRPMPLPFVIGEPQNDTLPIQANEENCYNRLKDFIMEVLKHYEPEKADLYYKEGILPKTFEHKMKYYFKKIIEHNHTATGWLSLEELENYNDDDNDDDFGDLDEQYQNNRKEKEDDEASFNYLPGVIKDFDNNEILIGNGIVLINNVFDFTRNVARGIYTNNGPLGCDIYAEAIIKLLRWGERRIRNLKFDKVSKILSMTDSSIYSETVDFESLKKVMVDGYSYVLKNAIHIKANHVSLGEIDAIIGIIFSEKYEDADGKTVRKDFAISIDDLIKMHQEDNAPKILGIAVDEETKKLSVSLENVEIVEYQEIFNELISNSLQVVTTKEINDYAKQFSVNVNKISKILSIGSRTTLLADKFPEEIRQGWSIEKYCTENRVNPTHLLNLINGLEAYELYSKYNRQSLDFIVEKLQEKTDNVQADVFTVTKEEPKSEETKSEETVPQKEEDETTKIPAGIPVNVFTNNLHIKFPREGEVFFQIEGTEGLKVPLFICVQKQEDSNRLDGIFISTEILIDTSKYKIDTKTKYPVRTFMLHFVNALVKAENTGVENIPIYLLDKSILNHIRP